MRQPRQQKQTALASATVKPKDPEAWVSAKPKKPAAEKPARLVVELPPELHRQVKGKCGLKGLKIKDVINKLLQDWVNA
jgi:ParG